ncbi:S41 family peptidase [Gramella sp. Hel_I_59]|uniref:S41 family peptidase n=1 Tax=Gramella sp. Hel_I_59 TaxID=1249978 RepID=UPI00163A516F|nr:S41 family peptidase [Gramella sp. Hel_I_59]
MTRLLLFLLFFTSLSFAQDSKYNLNFDEFEKDGELPDDWIVWGNYAIQKDSVDKVSGPYAAKIIADSTASFGSIAYKIPANYAGRYLKLQGYIKTENVANGFAGLLIRVDGDSGSLSFNNMQSQGLNGTNDWQRYEVEVKFPDEAKNIYVGGILAGTGTAWFDNFSLMINGDKDIQLMKPKVLTYKPAQLDTAFVDGSKFKLKKPSSTQVQKLYKLGKVWGFVKYHHPEIARGKINWDNELFRFLPKLDSVNFDLELAKWIGSFNITEEGEHNLPDSDEYEQTPDYSWIYDESFLTEELSKKLQEILKSKREKKHFYFSINPSVENPSFKNENSYLGMAWDDSGIKLLALYRYWNMMEYFNPNNYLTEKDWDEVLKEYIPRFLEENEEIDYKKNVLQLIGEVNDSHAGIWSYDEALNNFFGKKKLPLKIQFIEGQPVVVKKNNSVEMTINEGDVITHINNEPMDDVIRKNNKYYPASNQSARLRDMARKLLHTNMDSLEITYKNEKGVFTEKIASVEEWNESDSIPSSHKFIKNDIGYIYPESLKRGEINDILEKFKDTRGIVVDLRCYPSEFIVFSMGNFVVPKPTSFAKFTSTSMKNPGYFEYRNGSKVGSHLKKTYEGKLVLLINEETQSQAEYTAMALRIAPGAVVVGSQTAGADGNVSQIILPGGIKTMISGIGVFYPDGTETQRIGIVPDIEIKPTIEGFRNGEDELLNKSIDIIEDSKKL